MHRPLRISFDLDDTLVVYGDGVPSEPCRIPLLLRPFFRDPLRLGSRQLLHELHARGVEIWVYTTSLRSVRSIRLWWRLNGLPPLGGVINQAMHEREMQRLGLINPPTKLPGHWSIDVHVDDSEGVRLEQPRHSDVEVIIVSLTERNWASDLLDVLHQKLQAAQTARAA